MAWLFLIVVCGVAIYCNWKWCWQQVKPVWDWCQKKIKLWVNNPFLSAVILVFGCTFCVFGFLFYNNLYPLIESLYGLIPKDKVVDIEIDSPAFRNISLLIAGSATFAFAVLGMFLSVIRSILTRQQNNISQQGQITESMGRAITQIGEFNGDKPNVEVRVGGLYSLQFIMQDSPRHAEAIAKIFSTYVRENTKKDEDEKLKKVVIKKSRQESLDPKVYRYPRADIQVVFEIISQFNQRYKKQDKGFYSNVKVNFSRSNFMEYSLVNMNFSGVILTEVDFSDAQLINTNFSNANLFLADLSDVKLGNANLHNANLTLAQLPNANLFNADLSSAQLASANLSGASFLYTDLKDTDLSGAMLFGADLSNAKNLTQEQVNDIVYGDQYTKTPAGLIRPDHWKN